MATKTIWQDSNSANKKIAIPLSWRIWAGISYIALATVIFFIFYYTHAEEPHSVTTNPVSHREVAGFGLAFAIFPTMIFKFLVDLVLLRVAQKRSVIEIAEEIAKEVAVAAVGVAVEGVIEGVASSALSGSSGGEPTGGGSGGGGSFGGGGASGEY